MNDVVVFWFRRDLRLEDNAGLYHALKSGLPVLPIFIFDKNILNELPKSDARVCFIHQTLRQMNAQLQQLGSCLHTFYDEPLAVFDDVCSQYSVKKVFTNDDYEPYAMQRDSTIAAFLKSKSVDFFATKDHVVFEKLEVVKDDGLPYTVYTPYSKKWKLLLNDFYLKSYPTEKYLPHFLKTSWVEIISLQAMGFKESAIALSPKMSNAAIIKNYHLQRDFPSKEGTTKLGIHLRFGTVSIRKLAKYALQENEKFLNELIWRDFYQTILWHFPHVVSQSFKSKYDQIVWRNNKEEFTAWCEGKTGYPIVDAGMRQLNETGWMHNRIRMVVASFLTKHLLIDWRWGEAYFALKLNDFDLASNNGGWQWAAGSGVDAAPYFRVFNPYLQTSKFDSKLEYIRKWVPEFESFQYPKPIVEHDFARKRCLEVYKKGLETLA